MSQTMPWWTGTVIYQLIVRSFADGNGDGIGDFKGLEAALLVEDGETSILLETADDRGSPSALFVISATVFGPCKSELRIPIFI